jgi:hypothetical protein
MDDLNSPPIIKHSPLRRIPDQSTDSAKALPLIIRAVVEVCPMSIIESTVADNLSWLTPFAKMGPKRPRCPVGGNSAICGCWPRACVREHHSRGPIR